MPEQRFTSADGGRTMVVMSWDFAFRAVEITYQGALLTRLTSEEQLRSGVHGPTPDGATLDLRLVRKSAGDQFEISRDGQRLIASAVNWATPGPIIAPSTGDVAASAAVAPTGPKVMLNAAGQLTIDGKRINESHGGGMVRPRTIDATIIKKGQRTLALMTLICALMTAGPAYLVLMGVKSDVAVRAGGRPMIHQSLPVVAIGLGALTVISLILWIMSTTNSAEGVFGIGSMFVFLAGLALILFIPFLGWRIIKAVSDRLGLAADEMAALNANLAWEAKKASEKEARAARRESVQENPSSQTDARELAA